MHGINLGLGRIWPDRRGRGVTASYNFMAATLPPDLTFTRASIATDVINGVLTQFSSGQPRISTYNGYLSEGGRTNSLRNAQAGGVTAGVLGSGGVLPTNWNDINTVGLTREIIGSGTINGFSYIDLKVSGTPSAGTYELLFDSATQVTAASGQTWTSSFYIALIGGALTGITSINARTSGRLSGTETEGTSQSIFPTIDPTRVSSIRTLSNGTTTRVIGEMTAVVTAVPINATFRIAACQLEAGYGATSYIPTTSAAVTRSADNLSIATTSISGYSATRGTLIVTAKTAPFFNSGNESQTYASLSNSAGNYIQLQKFAYGSGNVLTRFINSYSVLDTLNVSPAISVNTKFKSAMAYQVSDSAQYNNGGSYVTSSSLGNVPAGNRLFIGVSSNEYVDASYGYIEKVDYYNTRKSNAELQVLSA